MGSPVSYVDFPVRIRTAEVVRTTWISATSIRLTIGGPGTVGFESAIFDEHVKLIYPDQDTGVLTLPTPDGDELDWPRPFPTSREYTVRAHRPEAGEVDIDFVAHPGGLAADWAREVRPGDPVHIAGPPGGYRVPDDYSHYLLAGDETALPAIARWLEEAPRDTRGWVVIEVAGPGSQVPDGTTMTSTTVSGATTGADLSHRQRRRFLRYVARQQTGVLTLALTAGAVRQLGFLALPFFLQHAVDDGVVAGDTTALAYWAAAVVAASVVQVLGVCCWDWWANVADGRTGIGLRALLADRVVRADEAAFGAGDLMLRSGRDVDLVRVWVHGLPTWSVIGTTLVVLVPGLFVLDPVLLAVAVASVPCLVFVGIVHPRRYEAASSRVAEAHGRRADHVQHAVGSAVTSRGIGGAAVLAERHARASAELTRHAVAATDRLARWQAWGTGVPTIAVAVGVLVGVLAVLDHRLTVGGLVAFSTWMGTIGVAVEVGLIRIAQTLEARVAADRLVAVLGPDGWLPIVDDPPAERPAVYELHVDGPVPLRVRRGEIVAVTGPTGCGKSALLSRVAAECPSAVLVPQRPLVLAGTVRDNLGLGGDVPDDVLTAALADVALDHELSLDDQLADGADGLSGGQIQRLALARALVSDPPVLLLDDITSAVDAQTEACILASLRRRAAERIVVIASHRRGVLAAVDSVIALTPITAVSP